MRAAVVAVYLLVSTGLVVACASWLAAMAIACWGVSLLAGFPRRGRAA